MPHRARSLVLTLVAGTMGAAAWLAAGSDVSAGATPPAPTPPVPAPTIPEDTTGIVPIPAGCPTPEPAALAFVGTAIGKDDVVQVVRFEIDQIRAGSAADWAVDGLIDIRYGIDYRFLDVGEQYLVGAGFDREVGALVSNVRPTEPTFGGNDVIGLDDTAVECPEIDDPVRTVNLDGSDVDSGVLSLLFADRQLLIATIAVPTVIAVVALIAIVILKGFGVVAMRGVFELGRAAVTPVPDHRAVRVRSHRTRRPGDDVDVDVDDSDADDDSDDDVAPTDDRTS